MVLFYNGYKIIAIQQNTMVMLVYHSGFGKGRTELILTKRNILALKKIFLSQLDCQGILQESVILRSFSPLAYTVKGEY
jgi:hypothetical protein